MKWFTRKPKPVKRWGGEFRVVRNHNEGGTEFFVVQQDVPIGWDFFDWKDVSHSFVGAGAQAAAERHADRLYLARMKTEVVAE